MSLITYLLITNKNEELFQTCFKLIVVNYKIIKVPNINNYKNHKVTLASILILGIKYPPETINLSLFEMKTDLIELLSYLTILF